MAIRATVTLTKVNASVTSEVLQAGVHYTLHNATGIWVDPDSKNRMFKDEYTLSEVHFTLLEKNLADSYTLPDTQTLHATLNKTETLALLENFARVVAYNRSFTDVFTLDDASQIDKDYYGNKGNVTFMLDIVGLSHDKVLTDSYTVADVFSKVVTFVRTFTETLPLADVREFNLLKGLTEIATVDDVNAIDISKPTTDPVVVSDVPYLHPQLGKTDNFAFGDTSVRSLNKAISDAFALDDAALVDKDYYGNKGNTVGVSDVFVSATSYVRAYADSYSFSDTRDVHLTKNFVDEFTLYDEKPSALNVSLLNTQTLNRQEDAISVDDGLGKVDSLGFTEVQALSSSKGLDDSFTFSDATGLSTTKPKTDAFNVSDDSTISSGVNPSDSISFSDSYERVLSKVLTDAFTLDDASLINKNYFGNKGNVFGLSEVITKTIAYKRAFAESVGFSDYSVNTISKNVTDSATLTESVGLTSSKILSDLATLNDVYGLQLEKTLSDSLVLDDSSLIDKDYFGNKGNVVGLADVVSVNLIQSNILGHKSLNTMILN